MEQKGNYICVKCGTRTFRSYKGIGLCRECNSYVKNIRDKFMEEATIVRREFDTNGNKIIKEERIPFQEYLRMPTSTIINLLIGGKDLEKEFEDFKRKKDEVQLKSQLEKEQKEHNGRGLDNE